MSTNMLDAVIGLRRALSRAAAAIFGDELSSRHVAVLREVRASGPVSQIRIARATASDPSLIVRVLDDLEGRGYVKRSRCETDRRAMMVSLTAPGRTALLPLDGAYKRLANAMQRQLTLPERTSFIAVAEKITRSLHATTRPADVSQEQHHASR